MIRKVALSLALCLFALVLVRARLHLTSDLTMLFPPGAAGQTMTEFVRTFGGGDLGLALVEGPDPERTARAADDLAATLRTHPVILRAISRAPIPHSIELAEVWRLAGPVARGRLAQALTPEGMQKRLAGSRAMLLAPGGASAADWIARDPLRLTSIPWEAKAELAAGVSPNAEGAFATPDGLTQLVLFGSAQPALDSPSAHRVQAAAEGVIATVRERHPGITFQLTGGHAVAVATESMLRHDLQLAGVISLILVALVFLVATRHASALVSVLPPLLLGTVWTTGIAALVWPDLSAIAVAFTAVVLGVGLDTGVHVYGAVLDARRRGIAAREIPGVARSKAMRPTLTAAVTAACAFGSLALSDLPAMRQLGFLCAVGEVVTALAILFLTPELASFAQVREPVPGPRWPLHWLRLMATPRRATSMLVAMGTALAFATILGPPVVGDAIVSLRPRTLAPLQVMDKVYARFGGRAGQWVVLSIDPDADAARRRSDRIAEALDALTPEGIVAGYDALATIEPSGSLAHERLAAFRSIDWSEVRLNLERALVAHGFDVTAFAPALDHLTSASPGVDSPAEAASDPGLAAPADRETFLTLLRARHLGSFSGRTAVATYVRVGSRPSDADEVRKAIASADPTAVVTGYPELERELRGSLARDLPRVGVVALLLVFVALRTALRRVRHVFVVIGTVAASFGLLSLAMRVANVELHVYDALVLPVLLGISVDEAVFLHEAVEQDGLRAGLAREGPLVLTTALTTASGFGALLVCDFPGLRDLGAVGALGSIAGLVATLIIVPAVARLAHEPDKPGSPLAEPRLLP